MKKNHNVKNISVFPRGRSYESVRACGFEAAACYPTKSHVTRFVIRVGTRAKHELTRIWWCVKTWNEQYHPGILTRSDRKSILDRRVLKYLYRNIYRYFLPQYIVSPHRRYRNKKSLKIYGNLAKISAKINSICCENRQNSPWKSPMGKRGLYCSCRYRDILLMNFMQYIAKIAIYQILWYSIIIIEGLMLQYISYREVPISLHTPSGFPTSFLRLRQVR